MTPAELIAQPVVADLIRQAAADGATAALRAADVPATPPPGGSAPVANVNFNKPKRVSLAKAIVALRDHDWKGAELERDFSQATRALYLADGDGNAMVYPSNASAYIDVAEKAAINLENVTPALRDWAVRAAGEATTGAGGALVPPQYLQDQFVLSLQTAVAFRNAPGVDVIPVSSNLIYFPRETVMPTSSYYAEAATITESDPTFGQQAITIKKQAALNQFSNELLADSTPAFEAYIARSMSRSVALTQDQQFLEGTGAGAQVYGLAAYQTAGLLTAGGATGKNWGQNALGATAPGTDYPLNMIYLARSAGWEPNAWIMHPRTLNSLSTVKDTTGRYILQSAGGVYGAPVPTPNVGALNTQASYTPSPWKAMLFGIPVLLTTAIPITDSTAGTHASHVYLGDFNFARVLERQAVEIAISDQIYFTTDQTAVRVSTRSAIVLTIPGAFMDQTGVKAS